MILFVELCVDLKKGKLAKDGLYQYKNTAQNTNVGTIEVSHTCCLSGSASLLINYDYFSLSSRNSSSLQSQR